MIPLRYPWTTVTLSFDAATTTTADDDDDLDDFLNSLTDDAGPAAPTGGADANVNIEDLDKALG